MSSVPIIHFEVVTDCTQYRSDRWSNKELGQGYYQSLRKYELKVQSVRNKPRML